MYKDHGVWCVASHLPSPHMPIDYTFFKGSPNGYEEAAMKVEALEPMQVLVKVTHAGICGSDVLYQPAPIAQGHEGVGTVQEVGSGVTEFKVGELVGWGFMHKSCGRCEHCVAGYDSYCVKREAHGQHDFTVGAFASHAIWDASILYKVPEGVAPEEAAPIMCGGATVFQVVDENDIKTTDRVGVVGIGGLGHFALQYLSKTGATVVAFSTTEGKKDEAFKFGATEFAVIGSEEFKKVAPLNHIVVTSNTLLDWTEWMGLLKHRATIHLLTLDFTAVTLPALPLVVNGVNVKGYAPGGRKHVQNALKFAVQHKIKPMIETFPFTKAGLEEGLAKLKEGKFVSFRVTQAPSPRPDSHRPDARGRRYMLARRTPQFRAALRCVKYSTALETTDLLDKYRTLVSQGRIQYDEDQVRVVIDEPLGSMFA
ncbi:hypothetical protein MKEN_00707900 [Mycena kentingensis (nom. inval.)]|nr:hypothetical protein MKEN_00707900 [Mycena kentingensis (nom. inval.)]